MRLARNTYVAASRPSVEPNSGTDKRDARRFILLLGLVSLAADATYESAHSIIGQFLASLGASAAAVGSIAGLGELLNNGLRAVSGHLADRTRRPWTITVFGFGLNMAAVPLLALVTTPFAAAILLAAERTGKAIRNPPRDAMLSSAARRVGDGRGFGLQEALGQIGAVAGPLIIGFLVSAGVAYRTALGALLLPAAATLVLLVATRRAFPQPVQLEPTAGNGGSPTLSKAFWIFVLAASLIAAGSLDFALIAFSMTADATPAPRGRIPWLYAFAMGMQAIAALGAGPLFDRRPKAALLVACALPIPVGLLAFHEGNIAWRVTAAMALWGLGLGAQKTVFKATIARTVSVDRRATAYGVFFAVFGLAWFAGSALMGSLHDDHPQWLVAFSVLTQLLALPLVVLGVGHPRKNGGARRRP